MGNFKHLKKEDNGYWVKQYISLPQIIILLWVFISIIMILYTGYVKTGIVILIFSLILTIISFILPKIYFNPISKQLVIKNSGLNRLKTIYDLNDFEGFELQTFRYGMIPLGCFLYGNFKNVSRLKRPVISQSFRKKTMQEVVNELEDLTANL